MSKAKILAIRGEDTTSLKMSGGTKDLLNTTIAIAVNLIHDASNDSEGRKVLAAALCAKILEHVTDSDEAEEEDDDATD